jgi:hypothetical protein
LRKRDFGEKSLLLGEIITHMDTNSMKNSSQMASVQEAIWANVKDLPKESIREILDFIVFIRTKTFHPEVLEKSIGHQSLHHELSNLDNTEISHLESEFADYQALYPHE